ncbi:hypothetical protein GGR55DRAFT_674127 [Xylaria sp. FL0064]|nr:hypothetical protein GGR55DRAFT_674127 [Xylaria sp. FL0064]
MDRPHETTPSDPLSYGGGPDGDHGGPDTDQTPAANEAFNELDLFAFDAAFEDHVLLDETNRDNPAQAQFNSAPESYGCDAAGLNSWFGDLMAFPGDNLFVSTLPVEIPLPLVDDSNLNSHQIPQSVSGSETMYSSDTLAESHGSHHDGSISPESTNKCAPRVNVEMDHCRRTRTNTSIGAEREPGDTSTTPYQSAGSRLAQVTAQPNPNETVPGSSASQPQALGHEWKPVVRKTLLPGCAVYAPFERKRQREPSPQNELHQARAPKARKKPGQICARCKLYREKCSGTFPCDRCMSLSGWRALCIRATFCKDTAFNNGLYQARALILLRNVKRWHPIATHPTIEIKVGIGFPPALLLQVNAFEAVDSKLLQHVNFRSLASSFLRMTETKPFGLYSFIVKSASLDAFFDELLPHLLESQPKATPDGFTSQVFQTVYRFSLDHNRAESPMLKKILRLWAAQAIFFGRIWRLSEGAERVGAVMHAEINAYDVPRFLYWQLDCIVERYAYEQELAVLRDLENFIFARKNAPWLSVVLTAYIYLTVLERDTWNLKSWRIKSDRWATDPRTMVWPLTVTPETLMEKNEAKARSIAGYVRIVSRGGPPFFKDVGGNVQANAKGNLPDVGDFIETIGDKFEALNQHLLLSRSCSFSEDDWNSLDYKFSRMIINATD